MSQSFLENLKEMCQAFFFGCEIKILKRMDISKIDKVESRQSLPGEPVQYNASKILSWMFRTYMPANPRAICIVAVTNEDIYPEDNFSFVFGLANVMTQVGIFSFCRYYPGFYGIKVDEKEEENLVLYRACKVMTHEIGHMFGIRHCIHFECGMNGCNHIQESETRPLYYCPVCFRKL